MHGAAEPAGPDIEACLAGTLAQLQRVLRKISRDPGSAAALRELADGNVTLLEVRAAYERSTADRAIGQTCADEILALGRQIERAQSSRPAASAPPGGEGRPPPPPPPWQRPGRRRGRGPFAQQPIPWPWHTGGRCARPWPPRNPQG